jgi:hypothetical protein
MSPQEFKYYLHHSATTNGLANALANGLICWWLIKDKGLVTWWGASNFGGDLLATGFVLPFIVTLIVIPVQRGKVRKGKVTAVAQDALPRALKRFTTMPSSLFLQSIIFGVIGCTAIATPTLLALFALGVNSFEPAHYAIFKGLWAGLLAFIIVYPMITIGVSHKDNPGDVVANSR